MKSTLEHQRIINIIFVNDILVALLNSLFHHWCDFSIANLYHVIILNIKVKIRSKYQRF